VAEMDSLIAKLFVMNEVLICKSSKSIRYF